MTWFTKARRAQTTEDYETWVEGSVAPTLSSFDNTGESRATVVVLSDSGPRMLTPVEMEALMGWPENHTLYRADGKTNSTGTRVRMIGNGVASPVATWIAERINDLYSTPSE